MVHIPSDFMVKINSLVYEFIWKGKSDKVNRVIFSQEYEKGGYKMNDLNTLNKAAKIKWISRYLDNSEKDWKLFFQAFMKKARLDVLLQANFDIKEVQTYVPDYYRDALIYWNDCIGNMKDYQDKANNQLIWYNKNFKVGGKTVFNENLLNAGIWNCNDLFNNGKIIPFTTLIQRGASQNNYLVYRNIIACMSTEMKNTSKINLDKSMIYPCFGTKEIPVKIQNAKEKEIKYFITTTKFISLKESDFKTKKRWNDVMGEMDHITWNNIYSLPHDILKCNKTRELQYKLLHRYIGTNKLLFKMKKHDSPRCSFCEIYSESIEHLFYNCTESKIFWIRFQEMWNKVNLLKITLSERDIIFGYNIHLGFSSTILKFLNIVILHAKFFIYRCKMNNKLPIFKHFEFYLKDMSSFCKYEEQIQILMERTLSTF